MNNVGLCRPCLVAVAGKANLQLVIDWVRILLSGGWGEEVRKLPFLER
jgi:hypothetical protein